MKNLLIFKIIIVSLIFINISDLFSIDGDTTKIRTIEFQKRREGWFNFPDKVGNYQRILMNYKLRCPPGKPCGEWDYIAHVYVSHYFGVNFRQNNSFPAKSSFMWDTSWTFEYKDGNIIKKPKSSMKLYLYKDEQKPTIPTDSINVWPTYYNNYVFDNNGKAVDSTLVPADTTIERKIIAQVDFNNANTYREDFEILRYITPYGNGLSLGSGFTWVIDVTDYSKLLSGKVYLHAPCGGWGDQYDQNNMEDLELTFDFIEGTPPRDLIKISKLWDFNGIVYDKYIENYLSAYNYTFNSEEKNAVLRIIQTGHGFGGTADNCAEFCRKESYVKVDDQQRYSKFIWRDCGDNPVYPQGGTWIFDRTNWCPGAEVGYHDYDISEFIQPNSTHKIDYDMEAYDLKWVEGGNTAPNWVIRGFLFTYGEPNFKNDARVTAVLNPTTNEFYNRMNPNCGKPNIKIQNTGKDPINKISLSYGNDPDNLVTTEIGFQDPLKFMDETEFELPNNGWYKEGKSNEFRVIITKVNDKDDEYQFNNTGVTKFNPTVKELPNEFTIELNTNNSNVLGINSPYYYMIFDNEGNKVFSKEQTKNSTKYQDKVNLPDGCYSFVIFNPEGYGLGFWLYSQQLGLNNGSLRFVSGSNMLHQFPIDWGNYYFLGFKTLSQVTILTDLTDPNVDFGNVLIGSKSIKEIKIFPKNSKGLEITDIKIPLSTNKKFSVKEERSTSKNPRILSEKDTLTLVVEFEPMSEGTKSANLIISSNDQYNSPLTISLNGNGKDPNSVDDDINSDLNIEIFSQDNHNYDIKIVNIKSIISGELFITNSLGNYVGKIADIDGLTNSQTFNFNSSSLSSGIYFINLKSNFGIITRKIAVVK